MESFKEAVIMVSDILIGILIVVIGVPSMVMLWVIVDTASNSASYLVQGAFMTVACGVLYYVFSTSSAWSNQGMRIFFGVIVAVAYCVAFSAAYRHKNERQSTGAISNE